MVASDPDASLVDAARTGDETAFAALVRRYQGLVFAVAHRLLGDRDAAEDITQETFIRAYLSLDRFRGTNFRAWVLLIAHNAALDYLRAVRRHPHLPLERAPEQRSETGVTLQVEQQGLVAALEAALAALPLEQRTVVVLVDVEGLSYEEAAEVLGVPVGTVKSRLARARVRLRASLEADPRARELLELTGRLPHVEPAGHDPAADAE